MKMNDELELVFERFKKSKITVIDLLGCYGVLISSKSIFNNNKEVANFLNSIFKIQLPLYVIKSRTLIIAKILRMLYAYKDDQKKLDNIAIETINKLKEIKKAIEDKQTEEPSKKTNNKKQNENDKLEKWLKGL